MLLWQQICDTYLPTACIKAEIGVSTQCLSVGGHRSRAWCVYRIGKRGCPLSVNLVVCACFIMLGAPAWAIEIKRGWVGGLVGWDGCNKFISTCGALRTKWFYILKLLPVFHNPRFIASIWYYVGRRKTTHRQFILAGSDDSGTCNMDLVLAHLFVVKAKKAVASLRVRGGADAG